MQTQRFATVEDFLSVAGAFLAAREAEHNLILGIASSLQTSPDAYEGQPLLLAVREGDAVLATAIRTPPNNLVLSETEEPVAPAMADALGGEELPGLTGPPDFVRSLAEEWVARHGGSWQVTMDERIYQLSAVRMPPPGAGAPRLAAASDRATIERFVIDFSIEAMGDADTARVRRDLAAWQDGRGRRRFWLWEVDGRPVCLVGGGMETPNGVRIGPVYTPPTDRGNGYASRLTAHVSQHMLDEGRRFCFLYTNQANATANHIYEEIGYEPVTDALMVAFTGLG
jgi:predicted GNAT family acetyltransferase